MLTSQRIDRLLRSLVGVSDARVNRAADGSLLRVSILRDARVQPHQLIRNIVTGLQAGFGVHILPTQIDVHDDAASFGPTAPEVAVPAPEVAQPKRNGDGAHGGARTNGGNGGNGGYAVRERPAPAATPVRDAPAPPMIARPSANGAIAIAAATRLIERRELVAGDVRVDRVDVERRGAMLRCRTVLGYREATYSAIAEAPDSPTAEAELSARVALDAMRAGALTEATLDGVGFLTIGDTSYVVVALREPGRAAPLASAAPLMESMAAAATAAVLRAVGTFTDARVPAAARA